MTSQVLIIAGAAILGILGLIHLIYGLATNKFDAYDPKLTTAMQQSSPVITRQTTMWKAWMGFNHSHSLGVLWIPLIYIPLALNYLEVLQQSLWLSLLPVVMAAAYVVLAKKYWFNIPLIGSLMAFACFLAAFYGLQLV